MDNNKYFEHLGVKFCVLDERPNPKLLKSGDWVRVCYDPYSSKPDIVAFVIANNLIWPLNHGARTNDPAYLPDDYQLELARNGDHTDTFELLFSQEYIELVAKVDDQSKSKDGRRLGRRP